MTVLEDMTGRLFLISTLIVYTVLQYLPFHEVGLRRQNISTRSSNKVFDLVWYREAPHFSPKAPNLAVIQARTYVSRMRAFHN